jgi:hypothetical protein
MDCQHRPRRREHDEPRSRTVARSGTGRCQPSPLYGILASCPQSTPLLLTLGAAPEGAALSRRC